MIVSSAARFRSVQCGHRRRARKAGSAGGPAMGLRSLGWPGGPGPLAAAPGPRQVEAGPQRRRPHAGRSSVRGRRPIPLVTRLRRCGPTPPWLICCRPMAPPPTRGHRGSRPASRAWASRERQTSATSGIVRTGSGSPLYVLADGDYDGPRSTPRGLAELLTRDGPAEICGAVVVSGRGGHRTGTHATRASARAQGGGSAPPGGTHPTAPISQNLGWGRPADPDGFKHPPRVAGGSRWRSCGGPAEMRGRRASIPASPRRDPSSPRRSRRRGRPRKARDTRRGRSRARTG